MTVTSLFFSLLRSELWQTDFPDTPQMPGEVFANLMVMAKKQTVEGLICNALIHNKVGLDRFSAARVLTLCTHTTAANEKLNQEVTSLTELLSSHHVKFFLVKGQSIGALYPHPNYRTCGDIDFYVYPQYYEKARSIIQESWNVKIMDDEEGEPHVHFEHNKVLFEMHFSLMTFSSKRNQGIFDQLVASDALDYRVIDGVQVPVLSPEFNLVYTFLHLYHHLVEIGVGMRQFCDLAILMNVMPMDDSLKQRVRDMLDSLNFTKAFHIVEAILHQKLGLQESKLLMPVVDADVKYAKLFMEIIFKRGNFGKFGRKNEVRSGWKYNVEAFGIKCRHYCKMFGLSPRENAAFLFRKLPLKVWGQMWRH